jgi:hypothetical protein
MSSTGGGSRGVERELIPGRPIWRTLDEQTPVKEAVRRCPPGFGLSHELVDDHMGPPCHFYKAPIALSGCFCYPP